MTVVANTVNAATGGAMFEAKHVEKKVMHPNGYSPYRKELELFEQVGIDVQTYDLAPSGNRSELTFGDTPDMITGIVMSAKMPAIKGVELMGTGTTGWKVWADHTVAEDAVVYGGYDSEASSYMAQVHGAYLFEPSDYDNDVPFQYDSSGVAVRADGAIVRPSEQTHWAAWCNAVAYAAFWQVDLMASHVVLNRIVYDAHYLWAELCGDVNKLHKSDTGDFGNGAAHIDELIEFSMAPQHVWVRTPLVEDQAPLLLVSTYHMNLKLVVSLARLQDIVVVNGNTTPLAMKTGLALTMDDIKFRVILVQVYMSDLQREVLLENQDFNVMTRQFQRNLYSITTNHGEVPLQESALVRSLTFAFRRSAAENQNEWFNFDGVAGKHALETAGMRMETLTFQQTEDAEVLHALGSALFCRNRLRDEVKAYTIGIDPQAQELQPGNCVNFSRFRNVYLRYKLREATPTPCSMITMTSGVGLFRYLKGVLRSFWMVHSS